MRRVRRLQWQRAALRPPRRPPQCPLVYPNAADGLAPPPVARSRPLKAAAPTPTPAVFTKSRRDNLFLPLRIALPRRVSRLRLRLVSLGPYRDVALISCLASILEFPLRSCETSLARSVVLLRLACQRNRWLKPVEAPRIVGCASASGRHALAIEERNREPPGAGTAWLPWALLNRPIMA